MFPFGVLKTLGKHKKKKTVENEQLTITDEYAIISSANNLLYAEELAKLTGNIEALLAISDRWLTLATLLEEDQESNNKFGFTAHLDELEEAIGEAVTKRNNKGKSKSKIRKKSR